MKIHEIDIEFSENENNTCKQIITQKELKENINEHSEEINKIIRKYSLISKENTLIPNYKHIINTIDHNVIIRNN